MMLISLLLCAAVVVTMSARAGQVMSGSLFIMVSYLHFYVVLWTARRASLKKDISFQVWLDERGFAVRRPRSELTPLAHIERAMRYLWPMILIPTFTGDQRRRVRTGDSRQPTLTSWDRNDTLSVEVKRPDVARLRITSRSYFGPWEWQRWNGVDAVVRLSAEQAPVLRDRIDTWISATFRARPNEESTNV